MTIYLDHNATTPPLPEVIDAVTHCLEHDWANPSSVHRSGVAARRRVELARESVAHLLGCRPRDLLLCSGGTEAANLALHGSMAAQPSKPAIATSRLEHSAVRDTAERLEKKGTPVHWVTHRPDGVIDLEAFESLLEEHGESLALVSVMWVNNETGLIQPVEKIGRLCREHGVRFHTDAVQAVGRMPVDCASLDVDLLSFAAHKFHGPKGAGGMFVSRGTRLEPQMTGGSQERDRRGGTENVPAIVGMGAAAAAAVEWLKGDGITIAETLRDVLEQGVRAGRPDVVINGADAPRLWTTSSLGFPRLAAEGLLLLLSERGVFASAGAACASGSLEPSPVLLAMGIPEPVAHGSVRFSISRTTTRAEIDEAIPLVVEVANILAQQLPGA
ncbi:MAG: cysteine desulfurase family protein [Planctomycetota bacterium]|jgi:cysteine desulfurase|nr:cysteine desulfurase family protein [Planctomycetota bacterium]